MKEIILTKVSKSFGEHKVIDNFSYTFKSHRMIAITGASGSGKSTLLNMIGLMETPSDGTLIYDGFGEVSIHSKKAMKILRYEIAYLFQNFALIDNETVYKNIVLSMEYANIKDKKKKAIDALGRVGLDESYLYKKIFSLSGGEQQRVALARIIFKPSSFILADEPTGNLDEDNALEVFKILKSLSEQGKCVIIVTHNHEIADMCHSKIELEKLL